MTEDSHIFLNIPISMLQKTAFGQETFFVRVCVCVWEAKENFVWELLCYAIQTI